MRSPCPPGGCRHLVALHRGLGRNDASLGASIGRNEFRFGSRAIAQQREAVPYGESSAVATDWLAYGVFEAGRGYFSEHDRNKTGN